MPLVSSQRGLEIGRFALIVALSIALLAAASSNAQNTSIPARFMSIDEYQKISKVAATDKAAETTLEVLLTGFWNMVVASSDADAKSGLKPDFCLPRQASWSSLRWEIDRELAAGATRWQIHESIGDVALAAMMQRWPCK